MVPAPPRCRAPMLLLGLEGGNFLGFRARLPELACQEGVTQGVPCGGGLRARKLKGRGEGILKPSLFEP